MFFPRDQSGYKSGVCPVLFLRRKADKDAVQV